MEVIKVSSDALTDLADFMEFTSQLALQRPLRSHVFNLQPATES